MAGCVMAVGRAGLAGVGGACYLPGNRLADVGSHDAE